MSKIIKFIWPAFLIFVFLVLTITSIGFNIFPDNPLNTTLVQKSNGYLPRFANWDGGHYRGIAEVGYKETQTVFFPLYPLLIGMLILTGLNSLHAGLAISAISTFIGLFFFCKLLELDFESKFSKKSCFYLLIYPTSFIFLAVYSEGLFFALSVSSFYFARVKKWKLAYFLAGLSAVTRLIGIALIIALFAENFVRTDNKSQTVKSLFYNLRIKSFLIFLTSFLPLFLYFFYLNNLNGNFFSFVQDEFYWGRKPTFFWETLISSFQFLTLSSLTPNNIPDLISLINMIFLIILFALFTFSVKKIRKSYRVYFILSLVIPLSTGVVTGIIRYSLVIFPIFITLSLINNKYLSTIWIILSSSLLLLFSILFINGFPID